MEIRHLVAFRAVARHAGFTAAASSLHLAQSAVSAQVRKLEAELGVTLFERSTRTVRLTPEGERLTVRVDRVLAEIDGIRDDLAEQAGTVRGRVRIGTIQATDPYDLPAALAAFHRAHPDVELQLSPGRRRDLLDRLAVGDIELAICPAGVDLAPRFEATVLFTDELVLVTSPTHHLATRGAVALGEVRDEPFVCLPADSGLRALLDRATAAQGFAAHVPFQDSNLSRIRSLAAHGVGVALLARSVAEAPGPPVVLHTLSPEPLHRSVALIRSRHVRAGRAVEACADFLAGRKR